MFKCSIKSIKFRNSNKLSEKSNNYNFSQCFVAVCRKSWFVVDVNKMFSLLCVQFKTSLPCLSSHVKMPAQKSGVTYRRKLEQILTVPCRRRNAFKRIWHPRIFQPGSHRREKSKYRSSVWLWNQGTHSRFIRLVSVWT